MIPRPHKWKLAYIPRCPKCGGHQIYLNAATMLYRCFPMKHVFRPEEVVRDGKKPEMFREETA